MFCATAFIRICCKSVAICRAASFNLKAGKICENRGIAIAIKIATIEMAAKISASVKPWICFNLRYDISRATVLSVSEKHATTYELISV